MSLEDILAAAAVRAAALVPETAGYLALAIADATSRLPLAYDERGLLLTTEGGVTVTRRGDVVSPQKSALGMRELLARLLAVSSGTMPGLAAAARPRDESNRGVDAVIDEIEAALIPVNRAAARRALGRLAREALRAKDAGKLRKRAPKPRPAPVAEPEPEPVVAPRAPDRSVVSPPPPPPSPAPVSAPLEEPRAIVAAPRPPTHTVGCADEAHDPTPTVVEITVFEDLPGRESEYATVLEATTALGPPQPATLAPPAPPTPEMASRAVYMEPRPAPRERAPAALPEAPEPPPARDEEDAAARDPEAAIALVADPILPLSDRVSDPLVTAMNAGDLERVLPPGTLVAHPPPPPPPAAVVPPSPVEEPAPQPAAEASSRWTRADDLLLRFNAPAGDDTSMRATAASLKELAGIDATPPPPLDASHATPGVLQQASSQPPSAVLDDFEDHAPSPTSSRAASPVKRSRVALGVVSFLLAGALASGLTVAQLRPDLLAAVGLRLAPSSPLPGARFP